MLLLDEKEFGRRTADGRPCGHYDFSLYYGLVFSCACGETFQTHSTKKGPIRLEICSKCHPFFTGKQKLVDSAGRVERFQRKYGKNYAGAVETKTPADS